MGRTSERQHVVNPLVRAHERFEKPANWPKAIYSRQRNRLPLKLTLKVSAPRQTEMPRKNSKKCDTFKVLRKSQKFPVVLYLSSRSQLSTHFIYFIVLLWYNRLFGG